MHPLILRYYNSFRNTELRVMTNKMTKRYLLLKMSGHSNFLNVYQLPGVTESLLDSNSSLDSYID